MHGVVGGTSLSTSLCPSDTAGGEGFQEGSDLGKGTGVNGVEVPNWYGKLAEELDVPKGSCGFTSLKSPRPSIASAHTSVSNTSGINAYVASETVLSLLFITLTPAPCCIDRQIDGE